MAIEEEYQDVLQNIEFAIVSVYRRRRDLLDYDVEEALDALIYDYKAQQQQRSPKPHRFTERPEQVYEAVKQICEWRLGRVQVSEPLSAGAGALPEPLSLAEIVACLKRIQKSVQRWNKRGGRQGYLQFIEQYIV